MKYIAVLEPNVWKPKDLVFLILIAFTQVNLKSHAQEIFFEYKNWILSTQFPTKACGTMCLVILICFMKIQFWKSSRIKNTIVIRVLNYKEGRCNIKISWEKRYLLSFLWNYLGLLWIWSRRGLKNILRLTSIMEVIRKLIIQNLWN